MLSQDSMGHADELPSTQEPLAGIQQTDAAIVASNPDLASNRSLIRGDSKDETGPATNTRTAKGGSRGCKNCRRSGHYEKRCKEPCSRCGQTGHTQRDCGGLKRQMSRHSLHSTDMFMSNIVNHIRTPRVSRPISHSPSTTQTTQSASPSPTQFGRPDGPGHQIPSSTSTASQPGGSPSPDLNGWAWQNGTLRPSWLIHPGDNVKKKPTPLRPKPESSSPVSAGSYSRSPSPQEAAGLPPAVEAVAPDGLRGPFQPHARSLPAGARFVTVLPRVEERLERSAFVSPSAGNGESQHNANVIDAVACSNAAANGTTPHSSASDRILHTVTRSSFSPTQYSLASQTSNLAINSFAEPVVSDRKRSWDETKTDHDFYSDHKNRKLDPNHVDDDKGGLLHADFQNPANTETIGYNADTPPSLVSDNTYLFRNQDQPSPPSRNPHQHHDSAFIPPSKLAEV